ncbi:Acyl-CoA thioesterase 2, partial [Frankliniella fusca]
MHLVLNTITNTQKTSHHWIGEVKCVTNMLHSYSCWSDICHAHSHCHGRHRYAVVYGLKALREQRNICQIHSHCHRRHRYAVVYWLRAIRKQRKKGNLEELSSKNPIYIVLHTLTNTQKTSHCWIGEVKCVTNMLHSYSCQSDICHTHSHCHRRH